MEKYTAHGYKDALKRGLVVEGAKVQSYMSRNGVTYSGVIAEILDGNDYRDSPITIRYTHCEGEILDVSFCKYVRLATGRIGYDFDDSNFDIMLILEDNK